MCGNLLGFCFDWWAMELFRLYYMIIEWVDMLQSEQASILFIGCENLGFLCKWLCSYKICLDLDLLTFYCLLHCHVLKEGEASFSKSSHIHVLCISTTGSVFSSLIQNCFQIENIPTRSLRNAHVWCTYSPVWSVDCWKLLTQLIFWKIGL